MSNLLSQHWEKVSWGQFPLSPRAVFLGSCFSTEIATRAQAVGWQVLSNPMGTLFQPLVIADGLQEALGHDVIDWEGHCVEHEGQVKCLMAGKVINAKTKAEVLSKIDAAQIELFRHLENANVLVITLGTAYAWKYLPANQWVANCQKLPQQLFSRELIPIEVMLSKWQTTIVMLRSRYPSLKIVFTVSPVRHEKLGVIENARSKAILLELCHQLVSLQNIHYFPSYEWITDELRDYRFYKMDGCHPSEEAIDFVFKKWIQTFQYNENL